MQAPRALPLSLRVLACCAPVLRSSAAWAAAAAAATPYVPLAGDAGDAGEGGGGGGDGYGLRQAGGMWEGEEEGASKAGLHFTHLCRWAAARLSSVRGRAFRVPRSSFLACHLLSISIGYGGCSDVKCSEKSLVESSGSQSRNCRRPMPQAS